ncbi:GNAT family N-acetyltransferase [Namhaeicola litoreus]|uniref:GNAT family N-acetyltransferase n=1 Tax=Namhaeicola litoreus TaxID=1052145 RepID=A0ABW3XZJ4_9FLAO
MKWVLKKFEELSVDEFHEILKLRINIFVVEQNCPYPELDNKDKDALHFFAVFEENPLKVVAYTRLFAPGDYYNFAAIGRVVVDKNFRGKMLGHELIKRSISEIETLFKTKIIKIGAQTYLKKFYESHGFNQIGEGYLEDGIPHIHMIKEE